MMTAFKGTPSQCLISENNLFFAPFNYKGLRNRQSVHVIDLGNSQAVSVVGLRAKQPVFVTDLRNRLSVPAWH